MFDGCIKRLLTFDLQLRHQILRITLVLFLYYFDRLFALCLRKFICCYKNIMYFEKY